MPPRIRGTPCATRPAPKAWLKAVRLVWLKVVLKVVRLAWLKVVRLVWLKVVLKVVRLAWLKVVLKEKRERLWSQLDA